LLSPLLFSLFINSASSVLHNAKLLIFADDMKLYLHVNSISDCHLLQDDLLRLVAWGESLGLFMNIPKCAVFTFTRSRSPLIFPYKINNIHIKPAGDSIRDLGFTFTRNLSPVKHIHIICCQAFKLLGFILRTSRDFQLTPSLKSLYCALVRPILEYGCVLWDPPTAYASAMLERVQRRFLRTLAVRLNIHHPPHDY
jgi:hypothetical protein